MQRSLSLPFPAFEVALLTVLPNRRHMTRDRPPSPDLPRIVSCPAAHVIAAVPLKPPARILRTYPSHPTPHRERLRRVDAEIVETRIVPFGAELRILEPAGRELVAAIGHVLPAKHAQAQHLFRGQLRREPWREIFSRRLRAVILIALLHLVVDENSSFHPCPIVSCVSSIVVPLKSDSSFSDWSVMRSVVSAGVVMAWVVSASAQSGSVHVTGDKVSDILFL